MNRAALLCLYTSITVVGCRPPEVAPNDTAEAWKRAIRRISVDPGDGRAHLDAARLAAFVRNDSAEAERLLERAMRAPSLAAEANLLRTWLAWRQRDYDAVLNRAIAVLDAGQQRVQARGRRIQVGHRPADVPGELLAEFLVADQTANQALTVVYVGQDLA